MSVSIVIDWVEYRLRRTASSVGWARLGRSVELCSVTDCYEGDESGRTSSLIIPVTLLP